MTAKIETKGLNLWYGKFHALIDVSLAIRPRAITAIIGPSGCGKSTLLRVFNRMNEIIPHVKVTGDVLLDGKSIYAGDIDLRQLRKRVGMVFQRPNPFPLSVFENVAYGPKIHGLSEGRRSGRARRKQPARHRSVGYAEGPAGRFRAVADARAAAANLHLAAARGRTGSPADGRADVRSGSDRHGQDRGADAGTQDRYTIVIVTHNMQQAARISDDTAFMLLGELVEVGETQTIFTKTPIRGRSNIYRGGSVNAPLRRTDTGAARKAGADGPTGGIDDSDRAQSSDRAQRVARREIYRKEEEVNNLQIEIDDRAVKLTALQQPVGSDVRFLFMASRIATELERIGDQAINICQNAHHVLKPRR